MINTLFDIQQLLLEDCDYSTRRFLFDRIDLTSRLAGLVGPRGVGKTTLMLQLMKYRLPSDKPSFYISADHIYFSQKRLFDFVNELHGLQGPFYLFIDEVHKYPDWNQEIKNIYDSFPAINVFFSGSSSLDLVKGSYDLSRRAVLHFLPGLSFREFLNFKLGTDFGELSFETIINSPAASRDIARLPALLGHFQDYLARGYYPFSLPRDGYFYQRLLRVVDKTIHEDIANFYRLKTENLHNFKKLLFYLASIPPGDLNTHNLAKNLRMDDKTIQHYVQILTETGLARQLLADGGGSTVLRKPSKLYLDNPTLHHAICHELGREPAIGTLRDLFLFSALENGGKKVAYSKNGGDFQVDDIVFEVGGKRKGRGQVKNIAGQSYVVKDDILNASPGILPLYLLGFLH